MVDMLILQTVFFAVPFAVIANIRWRRRARASARVRSACLNAAGEMIRFDDLEKAF
jgi:hypothetical protein